MAALSVGAHGESFNFDLAYGHTWYPNLKSLSTLHTKFIQKHEPIQSDSYLHYRQFCCDLNEMSQQHPPNKGKMQPSENALSSLMRRPFHPGQTRGAGPAGPKSTILGWEEEPSQFPWDPSCCSNQSQADLSEGPVPDPIQPPGIGRQRVHGFGNQAVDLDQGQRLLWKQGQQGTDAGSQGMGPA